MRSRRPIVLSHDLAMPLDAVTRTFGIFGQRETGKSTTGAVLVEQAVHAGGRSVVMDPTGVWYGLTRAGRGPGLPGVVLGGEHADAPLEPHAGGIVAEFVIGSDYPLVILDMKLMRKHQRQHFAMEFLEALYHDNRDPLLVVMDEAAQFAPQQMREGGDVPRLLGAVEDLVKLGRSRGLGAAMIEQRIATLNANVREQIGTLVAHRLVGPLDRKALKEWVNAQGEPEREAEALATISKLDPGTALVWSPAWIRFFGIVAMNNATTFDSRATPKVGERRKTPGKRAPVDLATLSEKMAASIQEARENDPKLLKQRVAAAEKLAREQAAEIDAMQAEIEELRSRPAEPVEVKVEVPVVTAEEAAAVERAVVEVARIGKALGEGYESLREVLEPLAGKMEQALDHPVPVPARLPTASPAPARPPRAARPTVEDRVREVERHAAALNGDIPVPQQKVLDAVAWFEALGVMQPSRVQAALVAGYSSTSGGYNNVIGKLTSAGLVELPRAGHLALTPDGRAVATPVELPRSNDAVHAMVLQRIPVSQAKLLSALLERWPEAMSREELAEAADYSATSGGFNNLIGKLTRAALAYLPAPGYVRAVDALFPMG